jgi:hypothetical protein
MAAIFASALIRGGVGIMGSTVGRMAAGAAAGGIYGAVTNPFEDPELAGGHILRSMALGATAGGLSRFVTAKNIWRTAKGAVRMTPSFAKGVAGVTGFALRNPFTTMALTGATVALAMQSKSPYKSAALSGEYEENPLMRTTYNQEAAALSQMDIGQVAPYGQMTTGTEIRNQRLMKSTTGLVQGLFSGRHG